jgi:hypothetical protein
LDKSLEFFHLLLVTAAMFLNFLVLTLEGRVVRFEGIDFVILGNGSLELVDNEWGWSQRASWRRVWGSLKVRSALAFLVIYV